jgi:Cft2 family RNA processing exonuclease
VPKKQELGVVWRDGLHLPGTLLWFDAPRRHHLSLVSHAQVRIGEQFRKSGKVLATAATALLCGVPARQALLVEYGRTIDLGELHIELFPSGSMLGGAQASVATQKGRVVYAGAINPAGTPTARPAEVRHCDTLVIEAPRRALPGELDEAQLMAAVERALAAGEHPIVVAPTPGPAQDLMLALARARLPLVVHREVARFARLYGRLGVRLPGARTYRNRLRTGEVLLTSHPVRRLDRVRVFTFAGVRADAGALLSHIEAARPRLVYLTGAPDPDLLVDLKRRGMQAAALGKPQQMKLFG